jgi:hypothetical protein
MGEAGVRTGQGPPAEVAGAHSAYGTVGPAAWLYDKREPWLTEGCFSATMRFTVVYFGAMLAATSLMYSTPVFALLGGAQPSGGLPPVLLASLPSLLIVAQLAHGYGEALDRTQVRHGLPRDHFPAGRSLFLGIP